MSGHSKWSQIKHKKEITDKKRARVWSKLLAAIQIAAKEEPNPDFNPRLRTAVLKAKEESVPQDNIDRAIRRAKEEPTEELLVEAYGPEGVGLIITALTDNKNRTMADIKKVLNDFEAKLANLGSVRWSFELKEGEWLPKFKQAIEKEGREKILKIIEALEEISEVTAIFNNAEE